MRLIILFAIILSAFSIMNTHELSAAELYGPPPPPPKAAQPVFDCPGKTFEWEEVYESEVLDHTYEIFNRGLKTLTLVSVKATCGCTTTDYTPNIAPGGKGYVKVKVKTAGYRDRTLSKTIQVTTNDPKHKSVTLKVKGKVKALLKFTPNYPNLEALRGELVSTTVNIKSGMEGPVEIISAAGQKTKHTQTKTEALVPGKEFALTLNVDSMKAKSNLYYDKVTVRIKGKDLAGKEKTYEVPLNFRIKLVDTINMTPKYITFRQYLLKQYADKKTSMPVRSTILKGWDDRAFKITKVDISELKVRAGQNLEPRDPVITVEGPDFGESKNLHKARIKVISASGDDRRYARYKIVFHTDDPITQKLEAIATVYFPTSGTGTVKPRGLPVPRQPLPPPGK